MDMKSTLARFISGDGIVNSTPSSSSSSSTEMHKTVSSFDLLKIPLYLILTIHGKHAPQNDSRPEIHFKYAKY